MNYYIHNRTDTALAPSFTIALMPVLRVIVSSSSSSDSGGGDGNACTCNGVVLLTLLHFMLSNVPFDSAHSYTFTRMYTYTHTHTHTRTNVCRYISLYLYILRYERERLVSCLNDEPGKLANAESSGQTNPSVSNANRTRFPPVFYLAESQPGYYFCWIEISTLGWPCERFVRNTKCFVAFEIRTC